jgi:hypothetical protein
MGGAYFLRLPPINGYLTVLSERLCSTFLPLQEVLGGSRAVIRGAGCL